MLLENIKKFFKKLRSRLTPAVALVVTVVLCVAALLVQYFKRPDSISPITIVGAVIVPFQEGLNDVGSFLFKTEQEQKQLSAATDKIRELTAEINRLKLENEQLKQLELENEELRKLLAAKERLTDYEMQEATIIASKAVNAFHRFTVNKGSSDGIKVDMNVITADGLVGIVTEVGPNYSVVMSIIEDGASVSLMTRDSHKNCMAYGAYSLIGSSEMKITNALSSIDFVTDNTLVTSYISDKYLPGLMVGSVKSMSVNSDGLT